MQRSSSCLVGTVALLHSETQPAGWLWSSEGPWRKGGEGGREGGREGRRKERGREGGREQTKISIHVHVNTNSPQKAV